MSSEHIKCPTSIEYKPGPDFVDQTRQVFHQEAVVLLRKFPTDKDLLVDFSRQLGPLMPGYRTVADSANGYIQEVRIRPDISPEERLATERDGELKPHTAHSWGLVRPQVFGLLMIDPGWRNQPPGNNGESILVRWKDIFLEMAERFPNSYEEDWAVLKSTNILFTAAHLQDSPANEPIIVELGSKYDIGVRYKENMLSVIERLIHQIPNGERYYQALLRFDEVAQTTSSRYEFPMEAGDLYLVDNRRVGHARRSFEAQRISSDTQPVYNPRFLFNIHILNLQE